MCSNADWRFARHVTCARPIAMFDILCWRLLIDYCRDLRRFLLYFLSFTCWTYCFFLLVFSTKDFFFHILTRFKFIMVFDLTCFWKTFRRKLTLCALQCFIWNLKRMIWSQAHKYVWRHVRNKQKLNLWFLWYIIHMRRGRGAPFLWAPLKRARLEQWIKLINI